MATPRGSPLHQRDVRRLHRHVGAGADGDADVRLGQRRRVVDAVADHRDDAALAPAGRATCSAFWSGSTSAITVSMPTCAAIERAVAWLSPVSRTTSMPWRRKAGDGLRGLRLQRVGDGDDARRGAVDRDVDHGLRLGLQRFAPAGEITQFDAALVHAARVCR